MTDVRLICYASAPPPVMPPVPLYGAGAYQGKKKMGLGKKLMIGGAVAGAAYLGYKALKKKGDGSFKNGLKSFVSETATKVNGAIDKVGNGSKDSKPEEPPK